jgi:hypothetical protein
LNAAVAIDCGVRHVDALVTQQYHLYNSMANISRR